MSLLYWFVPCWSGDFRLERDKADKDRCILTVEKPTAGDKARLAPFLAAARERGWIDAIEGVSSKGKTKLTINAPLHLAGPLLAEQTTPDGDVWTAVRCKDGSIEVVDGTALPVEATEDKEPVAAATVKPPAKGCPEPEPCARRASEVLRVFCTASQWAQFQQEGRLRAIGSATGRAYMVYHRDAASARGLTRSLVDVESGEPICVWDADVPSEEEVLSIKLAVEHRERWLLDLPGGILA